MILILRKWKTIRNQWHTSHHIHNQRGLLWERKKTITHANLFLEKRGLGGGNGAGEKSIRNKGVWGWRLVENKKGFGNLKLRKKRPKTEVDAGVGDDERWTIGSVGLISLSDMPEEPPKMWSLRSDKWHVCGHTYDLKGKGKEWLQTATPFGNETNIHAHAHARVFYRLYGQSKWSCTRL